MGREALSSRGNWQLMANGCGSDGEKVSGDAIMIVLNEMFPNRFTAKISESGKYQQEKMFYPNGKNYVLLDFMITDSVTDKVLLFESKRQNDHGNAHERAYKFLPGGGIPSMIANHLSNITGVDHIKHPIVTIFSGDMVNTDKYINEVSIQYGPFPYLYHMFDGDIEKTRSFVEYIVKAYFDEQDIWCEVYR